MKPAPLARELAAAWWVGVRTATAPAAAITYLVAAFLAPSLVYGLDRPRSRTVSAPHPLNPTADDLPDRDARYFVLVTDPVSDEREAYGPYEPAQALLAAGEHEAALAAEGLDGVTVNLVRQATEQAA